MRLLLTTFLLLQLVASGLYCQTYTGDIELYISTFIDDLPGSNGNDYTQRFILKEWLRLLYFTPP